MKNTDIGSRGNTTRTFGERAYKKADADIAPSGSSLVSAARATPVSRASHWSQPLVPRQWLDLRMYIHIPSARTSTSFINVRSYPL